MAYSQPELVLVGAAQNLVLEGSNGGLKVTCEPITDQDLPFYDSEPTW